MGGYASSCQVRCSLFTRIHRCARQHGAQPAHPAGACALQLKLRLWGPPRLLLVMPEGAGGVLDGKRAVVKRPGAILLVQGGEKGWWKDGRPLRRLARFLE